MGRKAKKNTKPSQTNSQPQEVSSSSSTVAPCPELSKADKKELTELITNLLESKSHLPS